MVISPGSGPIVERVIMRPEEPVDRTEFCHLYFALRE